MLVTGLQGAVVVMLAVAGAQEAPNPPGAARPVAAPAASRPVTDSLALAALQARRDSMHVHRRRMLDSITAAQRAAALARPPRSSQPLRPPPRSRGPFDEYTWPFYGTVAAGMLMGLAAFLLRHRDAQPAARRLWGLAGAILGIMIGAVAFAAVFIFFGMLSIGFSPVPMPVQIALSLLATAFGIAWLMSLRLKRLR